MKNKAFFKKEYLSLILLCSLPACIPFKKKKHESHRPKMETAFFDVDIPLAESSQETILSLNEQNGNDQDLARSFIFDEDDFLPKQDLDLTKDLDQDELVLNDTTLNDSQQILAWEQDQQIAEFKNIYFDFNQSALSPDQEAALAYNINLAKQKLQEAGNTNICIVIEGHACHSSGSPAYNLSLSEKRAQILAQRFEQAGIPQEAIKIVGRGQEIPVVIDGKKVTGNKEEQWINRRDEIKIIST